MHTNNDTYIGLSQLGKSPRVYKKTYDFPGEYINEYQRALANAPKNKQNPLIIDIGIAGWLLPVDALKLYEMAYFAQGNILELGTFQGLSTSIMARAIDDAKRTDHIDTDDIDEQNSKIARENIAKLSYVKYVNFNLMDATEFCDRKIVEGKQYHFVFIDHWHGYDATYEVAMRTRKLLVSGGFCLFHDYTDPANADPKHHYGVYQAANDVMMCDEKFEFYGAFGSTALFRKVDAPHSAS